MMTVSIRKSNDIRQSLKDMFAELSFNPGSRVYIKPNLSGRDPIISGENTSTVVMDALISVLEEAGCKEIVIGHGALLGSQDHQTSFAESLRSSGFGKYEKNNGIKIVNLDHEPRTLVQIEGMMFHLPLEYLKSFDGYINLAKIKTHMEATVSFSLKNQMGLPSPDDRMMMHRTDLERTIAKLALFCRPDLSILEGFPAMENNGPHHGTPRDLNLLIAGRDMVELDSFTSRLLGYKPEEINHIRYAHELGVGVFFPKEKMSQYTALHVNNFKHAQKCHRFGLRLYAYPTYSCSRCIMAVNQAGKEFKKHPLRNWKVIAAAIFAWKKINIVFGRADDFPYNANEKYICIGNCTKGFADKHGLTCLDKHPPGIEETRKYINSRL